MALPLGLLLVWLAVPRFLSGVLVAPHEELFRRLAAREPVAASELLPAIEDYGRALEWHDDATSRQQLAQLLFAAAGSQSLSARQRRAFLLESIVAQEAALARGPLQPYAWLQLSLALAASEGFTPRFAAAFRRAMETAPFASAMVPARVRLGLQAWPVLDETVQALVQRQVEIAAKQNPERLADLLRRETQRRLVRALLAERPEELRRLDAALAAQR